MNYLYTSYLLGEKGLDLFDLLNVLVKAVS